MNRYTNTLKIIFCWILTLIFITVVLESSIGQEPISSIEIENEKIIDEISPYFETGSNLLDTELNRIGFEKPSYFNEEDWKALPVFKKLVLAYTGAENHRAGQGEKMLALLSKSLAQLYEPSRSNPLISKMLDYKKIPKKIRFKHTSKVIIHKE